VFVVDLATEFEMDRSHCRRYLLEKGFTFLRKRPGGHGQAMLALSAADAEAARAQRRADGYIVRSHASAAS
jgi:hypothetical protein